MPESLPTVRKLDEQFKLIVMGFIRQSHQFDPEKIPFMIKMLILKFYLIQESFAKLNPDSPHVVPHEIISNCQSDIFGNNITNFKDESISFHKWRFSISRWARWSSRWN